MDRRADEIEAELPSRFWSKVEITDGCWLWTASVKPPSGYGQFRLNGRTRIAHRVVYEALVGPIPAGLHIDHLCSQRLCVRPDHLEAVTQAENNRRTPKPAACPQGHEYTPENTRYPNDPVRGRRCKACERDRV